MFGFSTGGSRVLVVSGLTGGCGATMLATNIAYELSTKHNEKTILLELSPQMGMVAAYLDAQPRSTTYDLLSNIQRLDLDDFRDSLTPITDQLSIIPGAQQLLAPRDVSGRDVLQLIDYAKRLASTIVIDLPNSYSDVYFEVLASASHVLLVGEQKLPSIRALKVIWDTLERDIGLGASNLERTIVINRFSPKMKDYSLDVIEKALGVEPIYTIANDHPAVSGSINRGRPLRVHDPKAKPLADIETLIDRVLGGPVATEKSGMFGKLRRAFGLSKR
jgi:pilus assembly protein CpaE